MEKGDAAKPGPETASEVDDGTREELLCEVREERRKQLRKREKVLVNVALDAQEDLAMEGRKKAERRRKPIRLRRSRTISRSQLTLEATVETSSLTFALAVIKYAENKWRRPDEVSFDEDVTVQSGSEQEALDEKSDGFIWTDKTGKSLLACVMCKL